MRSKSRILSGAAVFLIFVLIAGCTTSNAPVVQQVIEPPSFPPGAVMQTGDYAGFFAENTEALKTCHDPDKCTIALFNLAFLHSYSKSPYYDPAKALKYIEDLNAGAPGSTWSDQALVWKALIEKNMQKKIRKRPAHASQSKMMPYPDREELIVGVEPIPESVPQDYGKETGQGLAAAQFDLGVSYQNGQGVRRDYGKAAVLYKKAADQGLAAAQCNLGILYQNGQGVPKDYAKAAELYQKAAEQGLPMAQGNLGVLYMKGLGVPQDYIQAYMWCSLAAMQGFQPAVRKVAELNGRMTPSQIAEGQHFVTEWKSKEQN